MNAAVWIAARELRDRLRWFLVAAALAVVPFVAVVALRENRALGVTTAALFLAAVYALGLAVALGVSMVGKELAERRMSFLFAKPVSAAAIWGGKVAAALITIYGAAAIVVLPAVVLARGGWDELRAVFGSEIVIAAALACVVLLFVGHALSIATRSRSARVGLDFLLIAIGIVMMLMLVRPILLGGGSGLVQDILIAFMAAMLLVLAVAPVWQLARGRADLLRNHAALSTAVWTGMAVAFLGVGGYVWWVMATPPSRITAVHQASQDRSGRWVYVSGLAGHGTYVTSHLIDTKTGERQRIPGGLGWQFASDGRSFVWLESAELWPRMRTVRLYSRRLEPGASAVATPIVTPCPDYLVLSPDGSRIAMLVGPRMEVHEVASGRLLASAEVREPQSFIQTMHFVDRDRVRFIDRGPIGNATVRVRDLDVAARKLLVVSTFRDDEDEGYTMTPDGSRIYLRGASRIVDARTGAVVAELQVKAPKPYYGTMLADGTAVVTRDFKLYRMDREGKLVAEIPLPVEHGLVVGRLGASKIMMSAGSVSEKRSMYVIDLVSGAVQRREGMSGPLYPGAVAVDYSDDATFLAIDADSRPVLWDARTLVTRKLPS